LGIPEVPIDANLIVFTDNKLDQIRTLVKLVLGVTIESEQKVKYIGRIRQMDTQAQLALSELIKEV
jgi:hypothetical protein